MLGNEEKLQNKKQQQQEISDNNQSVWKGPSLTSLSNAIFPPGAPQIGWNHFWSANSKVRSVEKYHEININKNNIQEKYKNI